MCIRDRAAGAYQKVSGSQTGKAASRDVYKRQIINNGAKEPTVAELEQQARNGQPISLMDLAAAAHREEREKKKSVMEQLKSQPRCV